MLRATPMALALLNAAAKTPKTFNNFVARAVEERAQNTNCGVTSEPDVKVRARFKTRQHIANTCKVIV
jgi:hypothetical protein